MMTLTGKTTTGTSTFAPVQNKSYTQYEVVNDGAALVSYVGQTYRLESFRIHTDGVIIVQMLRQTRAGRDYKDRTGFWTDMDTMHRMCEDKTFMLNLEDIIRVTITRETEYVIDSSLASEDANIENWNMMKLGGNQDTILARFSDRNDALAWLIINFRIAYVWATRDGYIDNGASTRLEKDALSMRMGLKGKS
jgi:hypothetical protein